MIAKETLHALAKGIETYLSMRRDNKEEDLLKSQPKKTKGVVSKGLNIRLVGIAKRLNRDAAAVKAIDKSKKVKEQTGLAFQQQKYNALLSLIGSDVIDDEFSALKAEYAQCVLELDDQYQPETWLDEWVDKAKDISFATHVAKLTHSSSKGTSILDKSQSRDNRYLTTNSLTEPEVDTASSNAASLPIADILQINFRGYSVLDYLKSGDEELFAEFTKDKAKVSYWVEALKQAYDSDSKQSYFLSKQVYFPVGGSAYHLLLPLTSSSLAQALYLEHQKYFEEEQTQARDLRKKSKYSPTLIVSYPNKAKLNITASNHSNASAFNGNRGGKITLLSTKPPLWQAKAMSYREQDTVFTKSLAFQLAPEIKELKTYLRLLKAKELSDSAPARASAITRKLQDISSALFDVVLVTNQHEQENWTTQSKLSMTYQLLFEPWRSDDIAKAEKLADKWQSELCADFARWLNNQLNHRSKLNLTPIQSKLWSKLFAQELRGFIATQEVSL